ncbi:MAG: cytochrome b [Geminicoccaceae bacterium]
MRITNSQTGYGLIQIALHWGMALLIFFTAMVGFNMTDLPSGQPDTFAAYNFHKSLGITVLGLVAIRLLWRLVAGAPAPVASMTDFERSLATAAHHALYLLMFIVPLLGWLNTSTADMPVNWFGMAIVPQLMGPDSGLKEVFGTVHELAAKLLLFLVILHVLAALRHHFMKKDDSLRRMLRPPAN